VLELICNSDYTVKTPVVARDPADLRIRCQYGVAYKT